MLWGKNKTYSYKITKIINDKILVDVVKITDVSKLSVDLEKRSFKLHVKQSCVLPHIYDISKVVNTDIFSVP